jgi:CTP synthase
MSSLGKGIAAATTASLLQSRGFSIRLKKLDPYINIDPGTMSPYRHGEVFVMDDGCEADLDFGHYERFTDVVSSSKDSTTTGKVYSSILKKERNGDYLGSDIQVIPHVTNEIKDFIYENNQNADFIICEIGGTIGDIESLPYIESMRQMILEIGKTKVLSIHLTYLPYIKTAEELKTKPTQHSVRALQSLGVQPDILLCRSEKTLPDEIKDKLSMFCNIKRENVVEAPDVENIYLIPRAYHASGLDDQVLEHFNLTDPEDKADQALAIKSKWTHLEKSILSISKKVNIAVIGKYTKLKDAYISLNEALVHGGFSNECAIEVDWINSEDDFASIEKRLDEAAGVLVPGGFSIRGTENKILAIQYARENKKPFLGICLGMQLAVIESCRNIGGLSCATSSEFSEEGDFVIDFMSAWSMGDSSAVLRERNSQMGASMRLGSYMAVLLDGSLAMRIYNQKEIEERHRHRYEVNILKYADVFKKSGLVFSGTSIDGTLPEIVERTDHPFFIATQFHPELKSRPFSPHKLFAEFVKLSHHS